MNIHEYQAKALLKHYGVPTLAGCAVLNAQDIDQALDKVASESNHPAFVVKAQIHAGGRGKGHFAETNAGTGGGVRVCQSRQDTAKQAQLMLGKTLITKQTAANGQRVERLYIESGTDIVRELYLAVLLDQETSTITIVCSTEGGMDIEIVAEETPHKILSLPIDPAIGYCSFHGRRVAHALGLNKTQGKQCHTILQKFYTMFTEKDAELIEINPLIVDKTGALLCLDAKISFDNNALYRHPDIQELNDPNEENPKERQAKKFDLNYIALNGSIGCMVNGAGLAMATMDIIQLYGLYPANFLDVGGGANKQQITEAFKIITSDPNVKGILVNIFGGIMRCDIIAEGIISAIQDIGLSVPLIIRLEGTHVDKGKQIMQKSDLNIIIANDLSDAATKVVNAVQNNKNQAQ